MSSEDVPPVTVWVRFPVRVPEGTDPEKVVAVANHHLDDDDGLDFRAGHPVHAVVTAGIAVLSAGLIVATVRRR
jgi:hypothetical protein